jgi:hypothetical protein
MRFLPDVSHFMRASRLAAVAATATLMLLLAPAAYAQKPSTSALLTANEIVTTTGSMSLFAPLVAGVIEQAKVLYLQQDPGLNKDLNDIAAQMRKDLAPRMGEISGHIALLYTEHFSEQELKDLLAFYKTPVGKKLLSEQPIIGDASLKFAQDWANKLSDEVVAKMRVELKKKGHSL